jgi:membrane-bound ClpP family serine protease
MDIDVRFPIGLMFTILGLILTIFGLATMSDSQLYIKSLNINVNLWWGLIILVFGLIMLILSRRKKNA